MFNPSDLDQLKGHGIALEEAERQLALFKNPPRPALVLRPATVSDGILRLDLAAQADALAQGEALLASGRVGKFVPASGAATRMFQGQAAPQTKAEAELRTLAKALYPFHRYPQGYRTALEEQLREAQALGLRRVQLTYSPEHKQAFESLIKELDLPLRVDLSTQDPATDTLAGQSDGQAFRDDAGKLVFRPGGHGALLKNLQASGLDLCVIKNIDNIAHQSHWAETLRWKKILLGLLSWRGVTDRPVRVCGVVRNMGEPGGGPFWARDAHGAESLQIIESAQFDLNDPTQKNIFGSATHFNPVDIVCALRDGTGKPFELSRFCDASAIFISKKSHGDRELLALELPGLWNGGMALWDTLFVEVPLETFNPVKTVDDLLRPAHQA